MINLILGFFLRFFCESGPWNSLPYDIRACQYALPTFKGHLKTY